MIQYTDTAFLFKNKNELLLNNPFFVKRMDLQKIIDSLLKRIEHLEEELAMAYAYLNTFSEKDDLKRIDKGQLQRDMYETRWGGYLQMEDVPVFDR